MKLLFLILCFESLLFSFALTDVRKKTKPPINFFDNPVTADQLTNNHYFLMNDAKKYFFDKLLISTGKVGVPFTVIESQNNF